jgi:hypothetical protein
MDKFELLGFLLQDLRDSHGPDEEDIGPSILRETTRIYQLMIEHGHLTRDMFDLSGIRDLRGRYAVPKRYSRYQTTSYPITFVVFSDTFADWLLGKDERERLDLIDLIAMIKDRSWLEIEIVPQDQGTLVTVRSDENDPQQFNEKVLVHP